MYGKHFASMYQRSMVGSGAIVFAVMGYVIANYRLDRAVGAQVTLNPNLIAAILGETVAAVEGAITFLCSPDPKSTSKEEEGRRLVKVGEFEYRVVNGAKYTAIRNEDERREYQRQWAADKRAKTKPKKRPSAPLEIRKDEHAHVRNFKAGIEDEDGQMIREKTCTPTS